MFRKNQRGVIDPVFVLVLVLVLVVGGIVYWRTINNSDTSANTATSQESTEKASEVSKYTLPEDWSTIECSSAEEGSGVSSELASPNSDNALDCDDRTNTVLVSVAPDASSVTAACLTESKIEELKVSKPVESYDCEEITIDGRQVIKETANYGGGLFVSYQFNGDYPVSFTYFSDKDGKLPHATAVDQMVKSFQN